ncbi:hypothetical protein SEA_EWALD_11 [Gordonia phage Ewald]|nr:hypothetical protein SEA_EWALD_11 [Gordonia phage Ewald]
MAEENENTTTLDSDVTAPSVTEPGDGPADTTDATEVATSVTPDPGPEVVKTGTVNAVKKTGTTKSKSKASTSKDRIEKYTQVRPDGATVHIERNIDTGETKIAKVDEAD